MESGSSRRLVKRKAVASCLSCSICRAILNEATTLSVCLHTFCRSCITKKIVGEDISNCPQCDAYLGGDPLEKLRMDNILQKIRATIFPSNSYKPKVCDSPKLADKNIQKAKTTPRPEAKKDKHSRITIHFFENATVKDLPNQLTSRVRYAEETGAPDHQNPFDVLETGQGTDCQTCSTGTSPIWFSLISSTEKNRNAPVHVIKKYLVRKLNLSCEDEVEITLVSRVMGDHCRLKDLLHLWLRTWLEAKRIGEDSANDAVMPLVYARKACFNN